MIDVHCHLEHMEEPEKVILEAKKRGMQKIITSIPDPADAGTILHLKDKYPDFLKLCLGFHPNENANYSDDEITDYIDSIIRQDFGIVGIGEVGLEYPMSSDGQIVMPDALTKERKFSTFEKFIALANSM